MKMLFDKHLFSSKSDFNLLENVALYRKMMKNYLLFQIVKSLLEVFVGIEMTGQSVQFEQKFNYRRPMYLVMDYLWELPEHQEYFRYF